MRHTLLLAALAGLSLAGCAGMNENECQYSDWRAVGYEDGARGRGAEEFGRHRKSCAEHGVAADFAAWQSGRAATWSILHRVADQPIRAGRLGANVRAQSTARGWLCPKCVWCSFVPVRAI